MVTQYKHGCRGVRIIRIGRRQLEFWFCPRGAVIPSHVHDQQDIRLIVLGGRMAGTIGGRSGPIGWRDFLRRFDIPAGTPHAAIVTGAFCLFASWETWLAGEVTSAATDFREVA